MYLGREIKKTSWTWAGIILISINYYYYLIIIIHIFNFLNFLNLKLLSLEMYYLRRSSSLSRIQKIRNTTIRSKMQAEQSVLDRNQRKQLKWCGHLLRMEDSY